MTTVTETTKVATPYHVWRAIAAAATETSGQPSWVCMPEPVVGTKPLVMVDLRSHEEARAWAEFIGLNDPGSALVNLRLGESSISFTGEWLGWRVLVTGRQSIAAEAVAS